jgi:hypothetical protein
VDAAFCPRCGSAKPIARAPKLESQEVSVEESVEIQEAEISEEPDFPEM